jgi:formate/nitrite transporter FocA (FNT family)
MLSFLRLSFAMSTCPRCKGHLTDNHRCPRSPARKVFETILAATAGGLGALLLVSVFDPQGQVSMDAVFLVGGALFGVGLDRWLRG